MGKVYKKIDIDSYVTLFDHLTSHCLKDPIDLLYIDWECTPDKKNSCEHIKTRWQVLKQGLRDKDDQSTVVNMKHFKKVEIITKKGKVQRLKALSTDADLTFIIEFLDKPLMKFIHHRKPVETL